MTKEITELYKEFYKIMQEGDESKALEFLINNFNDLPEDIQREIVWYLFENVLIEQSELENIKNESLNMFKYFEKLRRIAENKKKEIEIRESIE